MIIWIIWRIKKHNRFHVPIAFSLVIFQIIELVHMIENKFKKHHSYFLNFLVMKIFNIQTRRVRWFHLWM